MNEPYRKSRRSFNEPGHAHFLTYSCYDRLPLLNKDRTREWVIEAMQSVRERHELDLIAYVIMPEHVHQLVLPRRDDYRMDRILADLKRPVSVRAKRHLRENNDRDWLERLTVREGNEEVFRFWLPGGGFDRNITTRMSLPQIIEYMHNNPVRRGLVSSPLEWEWSSARFWTGLRPIRLELNPPPL
jgi:putative transposase